MGGNKRNSSDADATGETISWVIVFILMIAFWPIGLILLYRKLRGYAVPSESTAGQTNTQATESSRQTTAANNARQSGNAARQSTQTSARKATASTQQTASQYSGFVRQSISEAYNDISEEFYGTPKKKSKKKKKRTSLEKKTGKFVAFILLIISIVMLIIGANTIAGAVRGFQPGTLASWAEIALGGFYIIGGLISFFSRNMGVRRISRYKNYYAFAAGCGVVPISDMARAAGLSERVVTRDIIAMINSGYFGAGAYIDNELGSLVLSPEAAKEARKAAQTAKSTDTSPKSSTEKPGNQYMTIMTELRELNATIADIPISRKITRIEELTGKIFRIVEENPEKLPQIRRFMNYYLPTTQKLLRSYATLEKQGIKGENITTTKESIGNILDTLAKGFEQQLDQLFKSDALDIASDINVLENMMQQDGLTSDKSEFKTMEST